MSDKKIFLVTDFDDTIVQNWYPCIGPSIPDALRWLRRFQEMGMFIILNTTRSCFNDFGDTLTPAVKYLTDNGINLYGINKNPDQESWSKSPKVYGTFYVDDHGVGCPLLYQEGENPFVDWNKVGEIILKEYKIMKKAKSFQDCHATLPKLTENELRIAVTYWDKCKEEVLKILKTKDHFIGSGIKSTIKDVEEL